MIERKKGYHRHHKVPVHAGGSDDDDNLIYLTPEEHVQAHLDLYKEYGRPGDLDAAYLLRACINREHDEVKRELFKRVVVRGAEAAHEAKLKNGFYKRLGEHNSKVLKGRKRPDLAAAKKKEWEEKQWKWFTNGIDNCRRTDCPEGWKPGRSKKK